jgi:hypothetical protein
MKTNMPTRRRQARTNEIAFSPSVHTEKYIHRHNHGYDSEYKHACFSPSLTALSEQAFEPVEIHVRGGLSRLAHEQTHEEQNNADGNEK